MIICSVSSPTLWHVQQVVQTKSQGSLKCICNMTDDLLYGYINKPKLRAATWQDE